MIKVGSDFSGVGAFDQALKRLGIDYETIFACDMDKYARKTFIHNYGEPKYYPENVYDREIPKESLDIYMTSPPCQAFSLAGKRKGEDDKRGVLFYNSQEFIKQNKPRYFIFENVKGLLSDDNGKTFGKWIDLLGGKSVNGNQVMFPNEDSVPYHIYHKVLNAKNYGVPQNRERVFIIGIRDDADNNFTFPKPFPLTKRLKDVLESEVDEKYYLSERMIQGFINKPGGFGNRFLPKTEFSKIGNCITTIPGNRITDNFLKVGYINQDTQASQVYSEFGIGQTLCAGAHGYANGYISQFNDKRLNKYLSENKSNENIELIDTYNQVSNTEISHTITTRISASNNTFLKIKSATTKGYELAEIGEDSINLEHPNSETRRGRVGKSVPQTLTISCNQGVAIGAIRGRNPENPTSRQSGLPTQQMLEINENGTSNCLTTVQKDNVVVENWIRGGLQQNQPYQINGISPCLTSAMGMGGGQTPIHNYDYRIRKLTPRECFRLMDFPDSFDFSVVSDSQAYKQAGNSIVVNVLAEIIKKLNL